MNEIEEERQQELRKTNIMIFGQNESNEVQDDKFVQNLIDDVGIESNVKFITRIGTTRSVQSKLSLNQDTRDI